MNGYIDELKYVAREHKVIHEYIDTLMSSLRYFAANRSRDTTICVNELFSEDVDFQLLNRALKIIGVPSSIEHSSDISIPARNGITIIRFDMSEIY